MQKNNGFSLTEVLVALFLLTSISLFILKQQLQSIILLNNIIKKFEVLTKTSNEQETVLTKNLEVKAKIVFDEEVSTN
ncbi:MAG: hypothetical protein A3E88_00795 [Legionellales bacterium RIFCSPHIGHO2_12_FULL_35_11]|nr:MAG: hypothetical protein A3E88_00795 [Legionellales bacterium RIFCSPHIGHO2_12_FULL_35_11]